MRFHKALMLGVVLFLLVALLAGCAQPAPKQEEPAKAEPQEQKVQGEGQGFKGPIKVEVTLVNGEIKAIEILEHEETPGISDPAFEQIPDAIIAAQSTEVDVVSGATYTSQGIMEAVANAIGK